MSDDVVGTGIEALDAFLRGGLPRGFTTLMLAPAGGGAEIFAKQFCVGNKGDRVVYVTTDESAAEVRSAVKAAGWDFGHVEVVDLQTEFAERVLAAQERKPEAAAAPASRVDPRRLLEGADSMDYLRSKPPVTEPAAPDYLQRLVALQARIRPPDRMVVHSLDFFLNQNSLEEVVAALTAIKAATARNGSLALWVLSKGAHGAAVERRLELLADCLLELEVTRKGTTFERFFMVKKVKNRAYGIGVSTYDITPHGFRLETLERIV